jgi:hypothetical protein
MKRIARRTLGAILGLYLGWSCAGLFPTPAVAVYGSNISTLASAEGGHTAGGDLARHAADQLVASSGESTALGWMLLAAAGLFVSAAAFGLYAQNKRDCEA